MPVVLVVQWLPQSKAPALASIKALCPWAPAPGQTAHVASRQSGLQDASNLHQIRMSIICQWHVNVSFVFFMFGRSHPKGEAGDHTYLWSPWCAEVFWFVFMCHLCVSLSMPIAHLYWLSVVPWRILFICDFEWLIHSCHISQLSH